MPQDDKDKKLNVGLTAQEVKSKVSKGLINKNLDVRTKSYGRIIRDNLFSLFNLLNLILFVCILISGSYKNGLFFLIVIWNFAIGVFQEVRAKKTIDKLSLITAPKVYALRDGSIQVIQSEEVVSGEIMQLKSGRQICADCIILKGECLINESMITGESEPVLKRTGDTLMSGSFIVSGNAMAEVIHVGADNYVHKITVGAKYVKKSNSIILSCVRAVVRVVGVVLIPFAGLLIWKNFFVIEQSFSSAMVATVASVSAMIPGGLILLVSMVMTVSVIKLSSHKTLAQDLYCVENLARIDVMCLDKTGTITEGNLVVEELVTAADMNKEISREEVKNLLRNFALSMSDENETIKALRSYLQIKEEDRREAAAEDQIPFSSETKWSLLRTDKGSLILGAFEKLGVRSPEYESIVNVASQRQRRVVAFARSSSASKDRKLPDDMEVIAIIIIADKLRENARKTLEFFRKENVDVRVISGDNPITVSQVAMEAGLEGTEKYIDAASLTSYEEINEAIDKYVIFGRVTPYQKADIIKALKEKGHAVAMIGDGANDVLALKEADCSIAMQSGSDAARNVSNLVLMDSDFGHMPLILAEGRKTINNLQRSAGLYLTKTTYAFILAIAFLFLTYAYPFQSIQVTLIGALTIGLPSFLLALEPNSERIKQHFLRNVFKMAIPSGFLTAAAIIVSTAIIRYALRGTTAQVQTAAVFVAMLAGFVVLFNISGRMDLYKWGILALVAALAVGAVLVMPGLFGIVTLSIQIWLVIISCDLIFALLHTLLFRVIYRKIETHHS